MELNDNEHGLDVSTIEVDSQNRIKLMFVSEGSEVTEFVDPINVNYLTLLCRNSELFPKEISLFTNLNKLLIGEVVLITLVKNLLV